MQLYSTIKQTLSKWLDVGTINPERDEALMPVLMLWVERLAILVVAIVSGIAVAAYGYLLASGYTSLIWVRYLSAGVFFALATAITDVGVKYFIQKGAFDLFAFFNPATYTMRPVVYNKKVHGDRDDLIHDVENGKGVIYVMAYQYNWFQRVMQIVVWGCMVGIIGGMFYFDYISVESVRRPVANMVKQEKQLNQDSLREIVLAQEKTRVGATVTAIQSAESEIRRLEKSIGAIENRVAANNSVLDGIDHGKKNSWELQELARRKNIATASTRNQIERERENLSFLRQQQGKELEYSQTVVSKSDSSTMATNAAIAGRNTDLVIGTSTMFIWLGFWAKCIAGIIRILLVAMFLAGNVQDYNKDGQVDYKDVTAAAPMGFQPG